MISICFLPRACRLAAVAVSRARLHTFRPQPRPATTSHNDQGVWGNVRVTCSARFQTFVDGMSGMVVRSDAAGPRYATTALSPLLTLRQTMYSRDKLRRRANAPTTCHGVDHRVDRAWQRCPLHVDASEYATVPTATVPLCTSPRCKFG